MIKSFRSKALERFATKGDGSKINPQHLDKVTRMLAALNVATRPGDMDVPGWKYHPLRGPMKGRHAVWVSGNWRLSWGWKHPDAIDVDLEDYH
jgi:proteic killer suppression protein